METKYISVSELTSYLKTKFDEDPFLQKVFVKGEISNFKAHTSGHYYFTLKDEKTTIRAIMFSYSTKKILFTPQDGMKVLLIGKVSLYESNGIYQIYVDTMQEDGLGNLFLAFEQLKAKLQKEGLFDEDHKQKIPNIPSLVGIVTAPTGAAIKDILSTIKRRYPLCHTILFPALVQGEEAAKSIIKQIQKAEAYKVDVLIIGRGGGSIEDLWPFNDESLARVIYDSKIPIVSAVGHEIDYTISDFVADLRAPTPTAAAELVVPHLSELLNYINQVKIRASEAIKSLIAQYKLRLKQLTTTYILTRPMTIYEVKGQKLDNLIEKLIFQMNYRLKTEEKRLLNLINKLDILNPLQALKRGYAIIKKDNRAISLVTKVKQKDNIKIELKDGVIDASVITIKNN